MQRGVDGLFGLYRAGDRLAGYELAYLHSTMSVDTGLEDSEAVELLVEDVRLHQSTTAFSEIFHCFSHLIPRETFKELATLCADYCCDAAELLENWQD